MKSDNYHRFFILESVDKSKPLSSQSLFFVSTTFEAFLFKTYDAKKLRTGVVLIEVNTQQLATTVLGKTRMAHLQITVTPHHSLDSCQGVVSEVDMLCETEADLLEDLKDQGTKAVSRVVREQTVNTLQTPNTDF